MSNEQQTSRMICNGCTSLEFSEEQLNELAAKFNLEITEDGIKRILTPKEQIKNLENQIASTDYQVIKCYEYSLAGLELPYDIQELHNSREAIREQIRELEEQI